MMKNRIPSYYCPFVIYALLILCMNSSVIFGHQCIESERLALLEFKSGILEDDYGHLSDWSNEEDNKDCCQWSGVGCSNRTGHVIRLDLHTLRGKINLSTLRVLQLSYLDLSGNDFEYMPFHPGTIPYQLGNLSDLQYLDLSGNYYEQNHIPNFIGFLTKLNYLDLSLSFGGTIPPQLGNLSNLHYLDLSGYYIDLSGYNMSVENLEWLSRLSNLEYLDMTRVDLSKADGWVNIIMNLPSLSYLSFKDCQLSQVKLPYDTRNGLNANSSRYSSRISFLQLSVNSLTTSIYRWLFNISNNVVTLDLSENQLTGQIPEAFGRMASLSDLALSNNQIDGNLQDFLDNLSGCANATLEFLDVGHNNLTGSLPDNIIRFPSLQRLQLQNNQLNGGLTENLGELRNLDYLGLSSNSLQGVVSDVHLAPLSKLTSLDLSSNKLSGNLKDFLDNLSGCANATLEWLDVGENNFTGSLPDNIIRFPSLQRLYLQNNQLNGGVTENLGKLRNLEYLDLSSNSLQGVVSDVHLAHLSKLLYLDLSSNFLTGDLFEGIPPSLILLDLSQNKFSGSISSLCLTVDGSFLNYLDLSHNLLTGDLPDCFSLFPELVFVDVAHNKLTGKVPGSVGSLVSLELMSLDNNGFHGELPVALTNCTKLNILKLGSNKLSGVVPEWLGANLFKLNVLSLRSNNFSGTIPLSICQLTYLSFIDLSMNRLSGKIPNCLNNLTSMAQKGRPVQEVDGPSFDDKINAEVTWQGRAVEFQENLELLKSIDLSSNILSGEIPEEITNLFELITLNLSRNQLNGRVPQGIGRLTSMCVLDLSRNMLSGDIPASMSGLSLLGNLDLSHNNLSGRIPSSTQLQSFNASTYVGNPGLCGPPLTKPCPGDELPSNTIGMDRHTEREGNNIVFWRWFGSGAFSGFAVGFCGVCGALLLNRHWGDAVFMFLSRLKDLVIIKVILSILKVKELI